MNYGKNNIVEKNWKKKRKHSEERYDIRSGQIYKWTAIYGSFSNAYTALHFFFHNQIDILFATTSNKDYVTVKTASKKKRVFFFCHVQANKNTEKKTRTYFPPFPLLHWPLSTLKKSILGAKKQSPLIESGDTRCANTFKTITKILLKLIYYRTVMRKFNKFNSSF